MKEKKYDLFISYRRDESINVRLLKHHLDKHYNIFFDQSEIRTGVQYEKKISTALQNSKCLLVMLTKNACKHFKNRKESGEFDWVEKEIKDAVKFGLDILIVRLYEEKDAIYISEMYKKLPECASPEIVEIIKSRQYCNVHLDEEFLKNDAIKLKEDIDITLDIKSKNEAEKKRVINWKNIIGILSIFLLIGLGYFAYKNFIAKSNAIAENRDTLKSFVVGKKDKDGKWSGWKKNRITINKTDTAIYFNLHYFANKADLQNIRIGFDKFTHTLNSNEHKQFSYFFTADNAKPTFDIVIINSLDNIELVFDKISWQENKCKSINCESKLKNYNSQSQILNDLYNTGIRLGNIKKNNYGNLVVKFLIKHNKASNRDNFGELLKPNSLNVIYCAKNDENLTWSGWQEKEIVINKYDKSLYVEIHYNAYNTTLKNVKLGLKKFPLIIKANEKINISAFAVANNSQPIIGNMNVYSLSDIELIPERISLQEDKCKSASCETPFINYNSEDEKIRDLFKEGINIGDKSRGHYGNLIIKFQIRHKEKSNRDSFGELLKSDELKENIDENKSLTANEDPLTHQTLLVSNKRGTAKRWSETVHVDSTEVLSFNIHYYGFDEGARNIRAYLQNLDNKTFKEDQEIKIKGKVSADNLQDAKGEVKVIFDEDVKLKLRGISWQKQKCQSKNCSTPLLEDPLNLFTNKGLYLGNLPKGDYGNFGGNLVVTYDVLNNNPIKTKIYTPNQSKKIATLKVSNKAASNKRWYKFVQVDSKELLSFQLHYYTDGLPINNLKANIDNLDGKVFNSGDTIVVKGKLKADNLDTAVGEVKVAFDEKVKLKLYNVSWQKESCDSVECETPINDNINNLFNNYGLSLGNINGEDNNYHGNLIVSYDVIKMKKNSDLLKVTPYKASMISPSDIPPLVIAKKTNDSFTKWGLSQDLKVGDIVALELHIYANKAPLQNIKIKLANITNSVFEADSSVQVSSLATASGIAPLKGSVSMQFLEKAKLVYWKYKWAIKKENSFNTETVKKLPNNQKGSDVFNEGIKLGSLPQGYRSNLILYFWVKGV